MLTVSHVWSPIEFAISRLLAGVCGSIAKVSRWGLRKPYAQISGRAPGVYPGHRLYLLTGLLTRLIGTEKTKRDAEDGH